MATKLIHVIHADNVALAMADDLREIAEGFADCALILVFGTVLFFSALTKATVTSQLTSCEFTLSHFLKTGLQP